jgi:hypothetical protein
MAENLKQLFSRGLGYGQGRSLPEPDVIAVDYAPFECAIAAAAAREPASLNPLIAAGIERKNELFRQTYGGSRENLEAVLAQNYDSNGVAFDQSYRFPGMAVPILLTVIAAVVLIVLIVAHV